MTSFKKRRSGAMIRSSPDIGNNVKIKIDGNKQILIDEFETLYNKIDNVRNWTQNLLQDALEVVGVDDAVRIDKYLEDSDKKHLGKTKLETLGINMTKASRGLGIKGGQYAQVLSKVGQTQIKLGSYDRDLIVDVCSGFILPLKYFLEVELNKLIEEREMLITRKNDYDYYSRQTVGGGKVGNKLKMAKMALEFQFQHAKETLTQIDASECQVGHLSDLVNAQSIYHRKCLTELDKLKFELNKSSKPSKNFVKSSIVKNIGAEGEKIRETTCQNRIKDGIITNRQNHDESREKSHFICSKKSILRCPQSELSAIAAQKEVSPEPGQTILRREKIVDSPNSEKKAPQNETIESGIKASCQHHLDNQPNNESVDGSTTASSSSRETQVIRLPARNDYRKNLGRIFFTPREEIE